MKNSFLLTICLMGSISVYTSAFKPLSENAKSEVKQSPASTTNNFSASKQIVKSGVKRDSEDAQLELASQEDFKIPKGFCYCGYSVRNGETNYRWNERNLAAVCQAMRAEDEENGVDSDLAVNRYRVVRYDYYPLETSPEKRQLNPNRFGTRQEADEYHKFFALVMNSRRKP